MKLKVRDAVPVIPEDVTEFSLTTGTTGDSVILKAKLPNGDTQRVLNIQKTHDGKLFVTREELGINVIQYFKSEVDTGVSGQVYGRNSSPYVRFGSKILVE